MKLDKLAKYSLIAVSLNLCVSSFNSTTGGAAFAFGFGGTKPAAAQATTAAPATTSPQIEAAAKRVDVAKTNLDLAHKRLDAAKALLKAADAEFKAAKTDKDALVLNTQAQQLADASGLPKNGENTPAMLAPANGPVSAASPVYSSSESTIDYSNSSSGAPTPSGQ
jgi:hypothetical protein